MSDAATSGQSELGVRLLVDFAFINRAIPIGDVLKLNNIETDGRGWRCWRAKHERPFSVNVMLRRNSACCYACPGSKNRKGKWYSVIDAVASIRGTNLVEAAAWIDANFGPIPRVNQVTDRTGASFYSLIEDWPVIPGVEDLVRAGAWARLSSGARAILPVILSYVRARDEEEPIARISVRQLRRLAGVGSIATVVKARRELESIGFCAFSTETSGRVGRRGLSLIVSLVRLTTNSTRFREWLAGCKLLKLVKASETGHPAHQNRTLPAVPEAAATAVPLFRTPSTRYTFDAKSVTDTRCTPLSFDLESVERKEGTTSPPPPGGLGGGRGWKGGAVERRGIWPLPKADIQRTKVGSSRRQRPCPA